MVDVIDDKVNIDDQNRDKITDKQDIYSTATSHVAEVISMMVFIGLIIVIYIFNPFANEWIILISKWVFYLIMMLILVWSGLIFPKIL